MTLETDFQEGFHGKIPSWLKTKKEDKPKGPRKIRNKN